MVQPMQKLPDIAQTSDETHGPFRARSRQTIAWLQSDRIPGS